MSSATFVGTAPLTRFALRRDRVRIVVWIAAIVLLVVTTVQSIKGLYPTQLDLDKAAADLDAQIPELERNEIIVGMMRIAAMVGDGHTRVDPRKDAAFGFASLPLKLYLFDDGLWVRATAPGFEKLLGARVEAIGKIPADEAIHRVSELASRENAIGSRVYAPLYLAMPDVLEALGLSDSRTHATLTLVRDGHRWTERVAAGDVAPLWPADTDVSLVTPDGWRDARSALQPLWLQAPLELHRLIEVPGRSALYVQLNMVSEFKNQSLEAFGRAIAAKAQAIDPREVILDLRLNLLFARGFLRRLRLQRLYALVESILFPLQIPDLLPDRPVPQPGRLVTLDGERRHGLALDQFRHQRRKVKVRSVAIEFSHAQEIRITPRAVGELMRGHDGGFLSAGP